MFDDAAGHAKGWDPNGVAILFTITEPAVGFIDESYVSAYVGLGPDCRVTTACGGSFGLTFEAHLQMVLSCIT